VGVQCEQKSTPQPNMDMQKYIISSDSSAAKNMEK
jgi:hypothetical protein